MEVVVFFTMVQSNLMPSLSYTKEGFVPGIGSLTTLFPMSVIEFPGCSLSKTPPRDSEKVTVIIKPKEIK